MVSHLGEMLLPLSPKQTPRCYWSSNLSHFTQTNMNSSDQTNQSGRFYHLSTLRKLFSFPSSSAESHFHAAPVHKGATWLDCCDDYFAISLCCISLGLIDRRTPSLFPAALLGISAGLNQSFQTWDPVNRAGKSLRWEQLWTTVPVLYCVCVSVCVLINGHS